MKIAKSFFILFLFVALVQHSLQAQTNTNAEKSIDAVLDMQVKAWNEGNIEQYMQGYWNSDSLQFIGKSGLTTGWAATLARYKKGYPNTQAMGKLSFDILSKQAIEHNYYLVIGKWHLQRAKDELGGSFSLLWRCIKGRWVIVLDHSS